MPWLGSMIFRRNGIGEFFKFLILLPLLYGANNVWALGFYRELTSQKFKKPATSDIKRAKPAMKNFRYDRELVIE